jgi:glycosyltransferase involved in cell wall biosynthesis
MLAAAKKLGARKNTTVLFVGTGSQADALQAALCEPDYVHCRWIEWLEPEELPGFWAATAVHFWALHDNPVDKLRFQAKLYEALATGTPVVIALEGFMSELLAQERIGITVPFADADSLEYELSRLLDDPVHSARIRENARVYAEANFDPQQVADAYERLLRNLSDAPQ